MSNLGLMLQQHGDLTEAETWCQRAAEDDHTGAI
ncbi:MAG: hypothetical protein JO364_09320 [Pseudonocardiales bacterium]|nr:hypothetical protein [Pseudonocardiales bacterium]MBV9030495.1 hypothetical protein [Pseudonocardiales bacterium]